MARPRDGRQPARLAKPGPASGLELTDGGLKAVCRSSF